jgi:hypothetical protein
MNKPTREQIEGKLREELHETVVLSAERGLAIVEYSKRVCELELELDKAFKRARMMETMAKKAEEERDKFADEIDVLEKARNEMRKIEVGLAEIIVNWLTSLRGEWNWKRDTTDKNNREMYLLDEDLKKAQWVLASQPKERK